MADKLPCISLWQPWASLIFTGDKQHETRAYPPPAKYVGRRIGIHAAKRFIQPETLGMQLLCEREFTGKTLPRGAIIGTAVLVGFGRTEAVDKRTRANEIAGDWTPGRWAWELADAERFHQSVPWKGKQGWFLVDVDQLPGDGVAVVNCGSLLAALAGQPVA